MPLWPSAPPTWTSATARLTIFICLIHQTNFLLDRQIRRLERDFVEQGGPRERMTRARPTERAEQEYVP
jgi:four helix bundle suffix protein